MELQVETSVSRQDSATFWEKGTDVQSLSRDKGTTGKAKNLAKGQEEPGQQKSGTGRARTAKIQDGAGTKWDRAEEDVLIQKKDVLKQKRIL